MAENVGHLAVVETSTDGTTFTEVDGENKFSREASREMIENTAFKDTSGHKRKLPGIKDGSAELGGHVVFAATLSLDTGIKNVIQRVRDGGTLTLRTKLDGSAGTYRGASGLVTKFSLSADVLGSVEWSASVQFSGTSWT